MDVQLVGRLQAAAEPCVVAIGTFDGVHRGHRKLLAEARALADERGIDVTAVTFSPRPETVFRPGALPDIYDLPTRRERLLAAGADRVVVLPFTPALARMEDDEFLTALDEHLGMRAVCVGEDFTLGRGRRGTPERIAELGYEVRAVPLVAAADGSGKASSSAVREAIAAGVDHDAAMRTA